MAAENANAAQESDLDKIRGEFEENREKVVEMLIGHCMEVDCSIPRVVRGKFEEEQEWI